MKITKELKERKIPIVKIDKALDKFDEIIMFPDKLERAKDMLKRIGLPKQWVLKTQKQQTANKCYKNTANSKSISAEVSPHQPIQRADKTSPASTWQRFIAPTVMRQCRKSKTTVKLNDLRDRIR